MSGAVWVDWWMGLVWIGLWLSDVRSMISAHIEASSEIASYYLEKVSLIGVVCAVPAVTYSRSLWKRPTSYITLSHTFRAIH